MQAKRIMVLMSPSSEVDIKRQINILLMPKPIIWKDGEEDASMDGQCWMTKQFANEYRNALGDTGEFEHVFQFRAATKGEYIAKGTVRTEITGLTPFNDWMKIVESNSWHNWNKPLPEGNIDIVMDSDVMKEFPAHITEPTIIKVPGNFVRFHRGDNHHNNIAYCGTQMTRLGKLKTGHNHSLLDKIAEGDRLAMQELLKITSAEDDHNPMRNKMERSVGKDLPITEYTMKQIETTYISNYVRTRILNTKHYSGNRFLCTDPAIPRQEACVPNNYNLNRKDDERFYWVSTPIINKQCVVPVKIRRLFDANVICVNAITAKRGYRDFDGDIGKVINL